MSCYYCSRPSYHTVCRSCSIRLEQADRLAPPYRPQAVSSRFNGLPVWFVLGYGALVVLGGGSLWLLYRMIFHPV